MTPTELNQLLDKHPDYSPLGKVQWGYYDARYHTKTASKHCTDDVNMACRWLLYGVIGHEQYSVLGSTMVGYGIK